MSWLRYLLIFSLGTPAYASEALVGGMRPITPLPPLKLTERRPKPGDDTSQQVLKIDNDAGVITAYRCTLADDELSKPEPQETDCVQLGRVRPYDLQVFQSSDQSCRKLNKEKVKILGSLAFAAASLGAGVGIVIGGFTEQFWRWGIGLSAGAALVGGVASYYFGVNWCERGLNLVIARLYDEVQSRVPLNRTRLIFLDDRTWRALDAVATPAK